MAKTDERKLPTFEALAVAEEAAAFTIRLGRRVPPPWRDQLLRSTGSAALNLAEGNGRAGRDRRHYFRIALGSTREAASTVRILRRAGVLGPADADLLLGLLDRVAAMAWRLCQART